MRVVVDGVASACCSVAVLEVLAIVFPLLKASYIVILAFAIAIAIVK